MRNIAVLMVLFSADQTELIAYPGAKPGTYSIQASVSSISIDAFATCIGLLSIDVEAGNRDYSSVDGMLYNLAQTELIVCPGGKAGSGSIPEGVASITSNMFPECPSLTGIVLPESITSIRSGTFRHCTSLVSISVPSGKLYYASDDVALFNVDKTELLEFPRGNAGLYTIPEGVTNLASRSLNYCSLTGIVFPDSLPRIGDFYFSAVIHYNI